jgi:hypothetical protein
MLFLRGHCLILYDGVQADAKTIFLQVLSVDHLGDELVEDELTVIKVRSQSHFASVFQSTYGNYPVQVGKDLKKTVITTFDDLTGDETYQIVSSKLDVTVTQLQNVERRRAKAFETQVRALHLAS